MDVSTAEMVVDTTSEIEILVGEGCAPISRFARPVGPRSQEAREHTIGVLYEEVEQWMECMTRGAGEQDLLDQQKMVVWQARRWWMKKRCFAEYS